MNRTCPKCGNPQVIRAENMQDVYVMCKWDLPEGATYTCGFCHAVRVDGGWRRTDSVSERAWQLKRTDERTRDIEYYEEKLT